MSASTSSTSCVPHAPGEYPLRWWLWFVLEHEIHHKAQLAVYVRQMGYTPPFYALPMPLGARPDVAARRQLQGTEEACAPHGGVLTMRRLAAAADGDRSTGGGLHEHVRYVR